MPEFAQQVLRLLSELGPNLIPDAGEISAPTLSRRGAAIVASLRGRGGAEHRLVVKKIPEWARVPSAHELLRIHSWIRGNYPSVAGHLPEFLACDDSARLVFMEYVPGPTLLERLRRGLRFFGWTADGALAALRETAGILRDMHRIDARACGVRDELRSNESFLPGFELAWGEPSLAGHLPEECRTPGHLYEYLAPEFFGRTGDRLSPVDAQPKNILVPADRPVCLIDVDYSSGNPALGLAQFLVGLDCVGMRRPWWLPGRVVEAWKAAFLRAYFREPAPDVADDLVFFYPWAVVHMYRRHLRYRPRWRAYLAWYYGRCLRRFLRGVVPSRGR